MRMLSMTGIVLTIVGCIKIWLLAQSQDQIIIPTCLGEHFALTLKRPMSDILHCWGCYISLFGIGLIGMDGFKYYSKHVILPASHMQSQNILQKSLHR